MTTYRVKTSDGRTQSFATFKAAKEAIISTINPVRRQIERSIGNGLPVTSAQLHDMKAQLDAIENYLDRLEEVDAPVERPRIVRRVVLPSPPIKG